jgi:hypothetical protein
MALQLEVGKTYLNKLGEVVTLVPCDGDYYYPFDGDGGFSYTPEGKRVFGCQSETDLISEVKEEATMKPANPYLTSMFEDVPATRKFVGVRNDNRRILSSDFAGSLYVEINYMHLNVNKMKDVILALEAAIVYLETQK